MNVLDFFKNITTFVFDVDGVLTDGTLIVMPSGGMYRRMKLRRWRLAAQMIRNMTTVLSWFGNVEPWRTALGPSYHRAGDGEH